MPQTFSLLQVTNINTIDNNTPSEVTHQKQASVICWFTLQKLLYFRHYRQTISIEVYADTCVRIETSVSERNKTKAKFGSCTADSRQ